MRLFTCRELGLYVRCACAAVRPRLSIASTSASEIVCLILFIALPSKLCLHDSVIRTSVATASRETGRPPCSAKCAGRCVSDRKGFIPLPRVRAVCALRLRGRQAEAEHCEYERQRDRLSDSVHRSSLQTLSSRFRY